MYWTPLRPQAAGWYWYRGTLSFDQPIVVHIYDVARLFYAGPWPTGITLRLEDCDGEWAGPIEVPLETKVAVLGTIE